MLSGYVFLSVLDIYAFGGFRDSFATEIIDEIIGGTGIFRWNLLDGSGWGVDAEDGGVDALRLYQHIHLLSGPMMSISDSLQRSVLDVLEMVRSMLVCAFVPAVASRVRVAIIRGLLGRDSVMGICLLMGGIKRE